jgi:hypothetical protein
MENAPAVSVTVAPELFPFMLTVTPARALPSSPDTLPETARLCDLAE